MPSVTPASVSYTHLDVYKRQVETFAQKQIAADKQRELNEAEQRASKQKELTASLVDISILSLIHI